MQQQQQHHLRQPHAQILIHECTRQQQQQSYTSPLYYTSLPSPPLPPTQLHPTLFQTKTPPTEYIINKRSVCYVALPSTTTTAATMVPTTTRARLLKRRARSQQHQQLNQHHSSLGSTTAAAAAVAVQEAAFPRVFAKMPVSVAHVKQMSRGHCVTCSHSIANPSAASNTGGPACRTGPVHKYKMLDATRPFVMSIQALIL